jgi:hypothetical protein
MIKRTITYYYYYYYYYFEGALHGDQTYEKRLAVTHSCISRLEVEELDACVFTASKSVMATPSSGSGVTKAKPKSIESSSGGAGWVVRGW